MYNIKMVSQMVGIPAVTIRAWERRYAVPKPIRAESGHRHYTDSDIEELRWLKTQTEQYGLSISHAVELLKQKKLQNPLPAMSGHQAEISFEPWIQPLYEALIRFQMSEADKLLETSFAIFQYETVFHRILAPLLRQVGDAWEAGKISVAQEHYISQYVHQRFSQFFRTLHTNPALPKVIALCPPGEHHQLGLLLFSLFLRRKGTEVLYFGSDTPFDGLERALQANPVRWVAISLTNPELVPKTTAFMNELSQAYPDLHYVLGGTAFEKNEPFRNSYFLGESLEEWEIWYASKYQTLK